jgi:hypothetical protein
MKFAALIAALTALSLSTTGCGTSHERSTAALRGANFAITRARAASLLVRFFPTTRGTRRCLIPGAFGQQIHGTCRVTVSTGMLGPTVVTFTETWPGRVFRYAGSGLRTHHHSWRFDVEGPRGRVISVKEFGDFPPQFVQ